MKLKKLHFDITGNCKLRCSYCFVSFHAGKSIGQGRPILSAEKIVPLIEQAENHGIHRFSISGGEALTHPSILRILSAFSPESHVVLFTSLYGLEGGLLEQVANTKCIKGIIVSLDGFAGHNQARAPSHYEDVLKHLEIFRKISPDCSVTINTVVTKYNVGELTALHRLLNFLAVNHWRIDMPMRTLNSHVYCTFEEAVSAASRVIRARYADSALQRTRLSIFRIYKSDLESVNSENLDPLLSVEAHPCEYSLGQMAVNDLGNISLCSPLKLIMGNIDEEKDFSKITQKFLENPFFALTLDSIEYCRECRYFQLCGTGCRADALEWTGDVTKPDLVACSVMPLVEQHIIPLLSTHLRGIYQRMIKAEATNPKYSFSSQLEMCSLKPT